MIWLAWRQFRAQSIVTAAFLAAITALLLVTGISLADNYSASGLLSCHSHLACEGLAANFLRGVSGVYKALFNGSAVVLYAVPALIGMFWGAPMVAREVETGTFRLAWNQSVSRTRWLAIKLGLVGLAAVATAGALSLLRGWWSAPIYQAAASVRGDSIARIDPQYFGTQGIAPLGYAAFAFALGVTAGLLIKRTIPAMAVTLAVFAFVQIAWPIWVRPHLMTPDRLSTTVTSRNIGEILISNNTKMLVGTDASKPGAWIIGRETFSPDGRPFTGPPPKACTGDSFNACQNAVGRLHLHEIISYQPASRFWAFQWYETAIFLGLALALAGLCAWRVRRHLLS